MKSQTGLFVILSNVKELLIYCTQKNVLVILNKEWSLCRTLFKRVVNAKHWNEVCYGDSDMQMCHSLTHSSVDICN